MNCAEVKQILRDRFDENEALATGLGQHLSGCPACTEYLNALLMLDLAMRRLPGETPQPAFVETLRRRVAEQAVDVSPALSWPTTAGLTAVAGILAVSLGWFFPVGVAFTPWFSEITRYVPHLEWESIGMVLLNRLQAFWQYLTLGSQYVHVPPWVLWSLTAFTIVFIVIFNWSETVRSGVPGVRSRNRSD